MGHLKCDHIKRMITLTSDYCTVVPIDSSTSGLLFDLNPKYIQLDQLFFHYWIVTLFGIGKFLKKVAEPNIDKKIGFL